MVGFVDMSLQLSEDVASSTSSVCVAVLQGDITDTLSFRVDVVGGSAEGVFYNLFSPLSRPFITLCIN